MAAFFGVRDAARPISTPRDDGIPQPGRGHLGVESMSARATRSSSRASSIYANFVPWQQLALERGARFRIVELTPDGRVDLAQLRAMLTPRTRVVAIAHVSNALGTISPVAEIANARGMPWARSSWRDGGAERVPHLAVDVDALGADFYAFSGHKMGSPTGIGGLIARREILEEMPPYQTGGDMIELVGDERTTWNALPHKFEAGTPNVGAAVGLAAAVAYLQGIGMSAIRDHERGLVATAMTALSALPGVRIYGPGSAAERSGVVSFTVDGIHAHDLATCKLDADHVCLSGPGHCAQRR